MNYEVFRMYCQNRKMIQLAESCACANEHTEEDLSSLAEMKLSQTILEEMDPEYPRRWEEEQEMFKSFTPEQQNFICSQIGWWYLLWKDKMWVDSEPNQHWLGRGKEDLKMMICGG